MAPLDAALGGGLVARSSVGDRRRAIVRPDSRCCAGCWRPRRTRGEAVALIDTCDRFDPASAEAAGLDLSKLLWVRDTGDAPRALKAMNLVLQAGGFGIVAFDLADVPPTGLRQFPYTTWMRIARVIEGSQTAAVLVGAERLARSPGGVTIALEAHARGRWSGTADRARLLRAIESQSAGRGREIMQTEWRRHGDGVARRRDRHSRSHGCTDLLFHEDNWRSDVVVRSRGEVCAWP